MVKVMSFEGFLDYFMKREGCFKPVEFQINMDCMEKPIQLNMLKKVGLMGPYIVVGSVMQGK